MLLFSIKVKVSLQGSCHRYGMIAVDNIKKGECLFEIPRSLLLKPESSSISGILENLTYKSRIALNRRSGWTPLLLALMYEYTNPTSHWKPYLNLVPDVTVLDQPYFWGEDELRKELKGIEILKDVERDIQLIEEEYKCIALPFIKKHPNYFSESCHTLDLYKHMAAFVMAYSFTEKSDYDSDSDSNFSAGAPGPVMVPMADILNHISKNNAHLEFGRKTLTMVAVQDIFEGQEVFNTYGELSNCDLLQSYGFVENELPNKYDVVDIPLAAFHEVMKANQPLKATQLLNAKFEFIRQMDVMSDDDMFHFGREGCSHFSPDLYLLLRILHLSITEFKQLLEEQIQAQRSETFDDIAPLLNQTDNQADEEMRRGASQRILELVLKAEKENLKEKRVGNGKNSEETKKKQKLESGSDEELDDLKFKCTSEIKLSPASNSCTETFNIRCENESNVVGVGGADCHLVVEGDLTIINEGENGSRTSNKEISEEEKMCTGEERNNYEYDQDDAVDDNKHDDDDDDDDYDAIDIDDGDGDNFNDNGEVVEDEQGAEEVEEEEEESDQTLTYDLLSQWPLEWRRTLRSVARLCVKQRFGEDKLDGDVSEDDKLSKRQLSVLRIRRGQRYIFQRICGLVDQTALPVAETTFLF